ncbi:hypothetical protein XPA_000944 [Xanthoria parietina]
MPVRYDTKDVLSKFRIPGGRHLGSSDWAGGVMLPDPRRPSRQGTPYELLHGVLQVRMMSRRVTRLQRDKPCREISDAATPDTQHALLRPVEAFEGASSNTLTGFVQRRGRESDMFSPS